MYDWPQSYRRIDSRGAFAEYIAAGADVAGPCHHINRKTPPISRSHQLHDVKLETASGMSVLATDLSTNPIMCSSASNVRQLVIDIFFQAIYMYL